MLMLKAKSRQNIVCGFLQSGDKFTKCILIMIVVTFFSAFPLSVKPAVATGTRESDDAPFYSGAEITNRRTGEICTSGPVLMKTLMSLIATGNLTRDTWAGATRWIITAGSCGEVGDRFKSSSGKEIGEVVWKIQNSAFSGLAIQVDPESTSESGCSSSSYYGSATCTVLSHYRPRAIARIYLGGDNSSSSSPYYDASSNHPNSSSVYYFSGSASGVEGPFNFVSDSSFHIINKDNLGHRGDNGAVVYYRERHSDYPVGSYDLRKAIGWVAGKVPLVRERRPGEYVDNLQVNLASEFTGPFFGQVSLDELVGGTLTLAAI